MARDVGFIKKRTGESESLLEEHKDLSVYLDIDIDTAILYIYIYSRIHTYIPYIYIYTCLYMYILYVSKCHVFSSTNHKWPNLLVGGVDQILQGKGLGVPVELQDLQRSWDKAGPWRPWSHTGAKWLYRDFNLHSWIVSTWSSWCLRLVVKSPMSVNLSFAWSAHLNFCWKISPTTHPKTQKLIPKKNKKNISVAIPPFFPGEASFFSWWNPWHHGPGDLWDEDRLPGHHRVVKRGEAMRIRQPQEVRIVGDHGTHLFARWIQSSLCQLNFRYYTYTLSIYIYIYI